VVVCCVLCLPHASLPSDLTAYGRMVEAELQLSLTRVEVKALQELFEWMVGGLRGGGGGG
jgi:hypothetical protein